MVLSENHANTGYGYLEKFLWRTLLPKVQVPLETFGLNPINRSTILELAALRPRVPVCFLVLLIGDMSNEETVFQVANEHFNVPTASSIGKIRVYYACVSGSPYLHQLYLRKMVIIK